MSALPGDSHSQRFRHLYGTNRWRVISEIQRRLEPLCRFCQQEGRITVGAICDHINGHPDTETEEEFFKGPFQTLCKDCHNITKRLLETTGKRRGSDEEGWPL